MADVSHLNEGDEVTLTIKGAIVKVNRQSLGAILRVRTSSGYTTYLNGEHIDSVKITKKAKPDFFPLRNGDVFAYIVNGAKVEYHVMFGKVFSPNAGDTGVSLDYVNRVTGVHEIELLLRDGKAYNG